MDVETSKNTLYDNTCAKLGKGEVLSSILSGSTTNAYYCWLCDGWHQRQPAVSGRTQRKRYASTRGKSVDFVHGSIREDSMLSAEEKFEAMIDEAIHIGAHELGLHSSVMAEVLERKLKQEQDATATADEGR